MRRRFDGEAEQDKWDLGEAMFAVRRFFRRETE